MAGAGSTAEAGTVEVGTAAETTSTGGAEQAGPRRAPGG